jgi:hypothetical protein
MKRREFIGVIAVSQVRSRPAFHAKADRRNCPQRIICALYSMEVVDIAILEGAICKNKLLCV